MLDKNQKGELFVLSGSMLWGLFPVVTILSFGSLSPLTSLGWNTLLSTLLFVSVIAFKNSWRLLKEVSAFRDIFWVVVFLGILHYVFYFTGLQYTSAGNASIIALTEIIFSYLFFQIWRKESLPIKHIVGAGLMLLGASIVLYPNITTPNRGDFLILAAAAVAPLGNFFQRRARTKVNAETILFYRSIISAPLILIAAYSWQATFSWMAIWKSAPYLVVSGLLLFGLSKLLWIEGIHRISVTKANALSFLSPLLTLLFAWLLLNNAPTIWQLSAFVPMFFGAMFLHSNQTNEKLSLH
ncbi:MAG: DMT family transporter [Patescibacteria group bacterium]|jgi:drug/metabolite transporter (DMT)-like permease